MRIDGRQVTLAGQKEDALFRVAHEALMNVHRHASATSVSATLTYGRRYVELVITDDGNGLPAGGPAGAGDHHFGIAAMAGMLDSVGGDFHVRNAQRRARCRRHGEGPHREATTTAQEQT